MAASLQPHLQLLLTPIESLAPVKNRRKVRHVSESPSIRMWEALDNNDLEALRNALDEGAKTNSNRHGASPFWFAVQQQRFDLAKLLMDRGANTKVSCQGGNVWVTIAKRDNPAEAERLKELLGTSEDAKPSYFVETRSYKLIEWWRKENHSLKALAPSTGKDSWNYNSKLALMGIYGPEGFWDFVCEAWQTKAGDLSSLSNQAGSSTAQGVWEDLIRRDNVALAQEALRRGWGPPEPQDYARNYSNTVDRGSRLLGRHWGVGLGWAILEADAPNLWAWWCQLPGMLETMREESRAENQRHDTVVQILKTLKDLQKLEAVGMLDFGRDKKGDWMLHHVLLKKTLDKPLVRWWMKNRPEDFNQVNDSNQTPIDPKRLGENSANLRLIKEQTLEVQLPEANKDVKRQRF